MKQRKSGDLDSHSAWLLSGCESAKHSDNRVEFIRIEGENQ